MFTDEMIDCSDLTNGYSCFADNSRPLPGIWRARLGIGLNSEGEAERDKTVVVAYGESQDALEGAAQRWGRAVALDCSSSRRSRTDSECYLEAL